MTAPNPHVLAAIIRRREADWYLDEAARVWVCYSPSGRQEDEPATDDEVAAFAWALASNNGGTGMKQDGEDASPVMSLGQTLFEALRHFVHLDESNAAIHCSRVRYSPLTFRLAEHLADMDGEWFEDAYVLTVLSHVGQYAEDTGR